MSYVIPASTPQKEGPLYVSKWIKIPTLLDADEMEALLTHLEHQVGPFMSYQISGVVKEGEGVSPPAYLAARYREYAIALKLGKMLPEEHVRAHFGVGLSLSPDLFYAVPVPPTRQLLKPRAPIVQLQPAWIRYSALEGEFRCQVYGSDCISWGLVWGFPHVFQDPHTHQVSTAESFINTPLFKALQGWIRTHTLPTYFMVGQTRITTSIRTGRQCMAWAGQHPQLEGQGITLFHR